MTARNPAHGIGHGEHRQTERKGHADKTNSKLGIGRGQHGTAASAEDQPERAEKFGNKTLCMDISSALNQRVSNESVTIRFRSSTRATPRQASRKEGKPKDLR